MSEVLVVPRGSHGQLELHSSEVTEPIDLVLDCNSEDFGMLDDVHRLWNCDIGWGCFRSGSLGSDCGERFFIQKTNLDLFLDHPPPLRWARVVKLYLSFRVGRGGSGFDLRQWKVVEVVEEIHHEFHNLRIVAGVVSFLRGFRAVLDSLQFDGAVSAFLQHVRTEFILEPAVEHPYLESTLLERGPEIL